MLSRRQELDFRSMVDDGKQGELMQMGPQMTKAGGDMVFSVMLWLQARWFFR